MDTITLVLFIAGLGLLILGADLLVRGASRLAAAIGISPLAIGLTVVAYGTSAPELAVSVQASLAGQADISAGNVVGSNIFNVLFILGVSAIVRPLVVARQLVIREVPILIATAVAGYLLALDGRVGRIDGAILLGAGAAYTAFLLARGRKAGPAAEPARGAGADDTGAPSAMGGPGFVLARAALVVAGLAALVLGSRWLVGGAVALARTLGLGELVIGLTIVAAGTSLPEVATSILAAVRGERDIAVGNVVGSNISNILVVLGLAALVAPAGIRVSEGLLTFDFPVLLAVSVACLPIFFTGHRISRWEGILFLGYYAAYTAWLVLEATEHAALHGYGTVMIAFVIPLTAVTLALVTFRALRAGGSSRGS